jgi:hypothetical protein
MALALLSKNFIASRALVSIQQAALAQQRFQNTQSNPTERKPFTVSKVENADNLNKPVKPYKFSPFQVSYKENKVDFTLARLDDLMNFVRRVNKNVFLKFKS